MSVKEQAVQYAQNHGLYLFPTRQNKAPLTAHGFKDATNQYERVEQLFRHEGRGIGVHPGRSGYVVVDIDVKDGATGEDQWNELGIDFAGPEVITPSGGRHLWFRKPEGMEFDNTGLDDSIDIRSDGGYVILPDSFEYRWDVGWDHACQECDFYHPVLDEAPMFPESLVNKLTEAKEFVPGEIKDGPIMAGARYATLFSIGSKMRYNGVPEAAILNAMLETNRARCQPPHPDEHVTKIFTHVMDPNNPPINPATGAPTPEVTFRRKRKGKRVLAGMAEAGSDTDIDWLWYPYIPYGQITDLIGDGDVGKSWIAMSVAAELSRQGHNSLYYSVESGTVDQIKSRWRLFDTGEGELYVPAEVHDDIKLPISFYMNTVEGMQDLEEDIKSTGAKLVIIDPAPTYLQGTPNSEDVVRPFLEGLIELASKYTLAFINIRHVNKSTLATTASMRGAGSVAWRNAARSGLLAGEYMPTGERVMVHHKANLSPEGKGPSLGYTLLPGKGFEWQGESPLTDHNLLGPENVSLDTTEAINLALDVLADGRMHMVKELELASRGLDISKKTLHAALRKMEARGRLAKDREYVYLVTPKGGETNV